MALMMGKLYAALRAANVPEPQAIAAAEEVAEYENRLSAIDTRLPVLAWMTGSLVVLLVPAIGLLLRIAAKVGAL